MAQHLGHEGCQDAQSHHEAGAAEVLGEGDRCHGGDPGQRHDHGGTPVMA